jgi:hypothetical protein
MEALRGFRSAYLGRSIGALVTQTPWGPVNEEQWNSDRGTFLDPEGDVPAKFDYDECKFRWKDIPEIQENICAGATGNWRC